MDIGKVAKKSGIAPSTLRYYEKIGLIQSIGRNGLRRDFDANVLQTLALITLGKNAGFSLEEISQMLTVDGPKIARDKLKAKADQIDQKIARLKAIRDGLYHAAKCPHDDHLECPKFQHLMRTAIKNQININS